MSSNSGNPSKAAGQWHATKGEIKQGLGRTFASSNLQQEGIAEREAGRAEMAAARAQRAGDAPGSNDGFSNQPNSSAGANAFAGGPDYGNLEGPAYTSGEPKNVLGMGTGTTTIGGGTGGTGGAGFGNRGTAGDAHLGNDDFSSSTNRPGYMGTAAAYNEFEPTGTDTLSGTNTPSGLARGQAAMQNRNAQQDVKEWSRNAF